MGLTFPKSRCGLHSRIGLVRGSMAAVLLLGAKLHAVGPDGRPTAACLVHRSCLAARGPAPSSKDPPRPKTLEVRSVEAWSPTLLPAQRGLVLETEPRPR